MHPSRNPKAVPLEQGVRLRRRPRRATISNFFQSANEGGGQVGLIFHDKNVHGQIGSGVYEFACDTRMKGLLRANHDPKETELRESFLSRCAALQPCGVYRIHAEILKVSYDS
jgi:hypothetical protein